MHYCFHVIVLLHTFAVQNDFWKKYWLFLTYPLFCKFSDNDLPIPQGLKISSACEKNLSWKVRKRILLLINQTNLMHY